MKNKCDITVSEKGGENENKRKQQKTLHRISERMKMNIGPFQTRNDVLNGIFVCKRKQNENKRRKNTKFMIFSILKAKTHA